MNQDPCISVIVVCRNPGPALKEALESVWSQKVERADVVVIDGASTDGTARWLADQAGRFGYMHSKPDAGVYQAMNYGTAAARGRWLLFLGADDRLASDSVLAEARTYLDDTQATVAVGEAVYGDGRTYRYDARPHPIRRNFIHHQACFYRRTLFDSRRYDETLRIQGDYDLNLRLWCEHVRPLALPLRISVCTSGGLSDSGSWSNYREEIAVRHRHFGAMRCLSWDIGSVVRYIRKRYIRAPHRAHGAKR